LVTEAAPSGLLDGTPGSAVFSEDRVYRYLLTRVWGGRRAMVFVMLNPSTADALVDDQTIRRCRGFAVREGCGSLRVVNLFALRSTNPMALQTHPDPVGPENDRLIRKYTGAAGDSVVVVAWGSHGFARDRALVVAGGLRDAGHELWCLGVTGDGSPRHPSRVRNDAPLVPWER
jgi:hypothetical protein